MLALTHAERGVLAGTRGLGFIVRRYRPNSDWVGAVADIAFAGVLVAGTPAAGATGMPPKTGVGASADETMVVNP